MKSESYTFKFTHSTSLDNATKHWTKCIITRDETGEIVKGKTFAKLDESYSPAVEKATAVANAIEKLNDEALQDKMARAMIKVLTNMSSAEDDITRIGKWYEVYQLAITQMNKEEAATYRTDMNPDIFVTGIQELGD